MGKASDLSDERKKESTMSFSTYTLYIECYPLERAMVW